MNKKYYWVKLQRNFFDKGEIQYIIQHGGEDLAEKSIIVYLRLMLYSINNGGKLSYEINGENVKMTYQKMANICEYYSVDTIREVYTMLIECGLIVEDTIKGDYITDINSYIGSETYAAESMRELRKQRKAKK